MKDAKYRRLGGACVCGRKVLLSHGGAGGMDKWDCCSPWLAAAENAERSIIATRRPIFNRQHAHPEACEALIRYLVERSRFDLLEVNATWG